MTIEKGLLNTDFHLPYNPNLIQRAKDLRKNMTLAEKQIWYNYLRNFKFRVLRQRPIDHFIVDFYCHKLKLVIEIDGVSHFTDEGKAYDSLRTQVLEGYGLKVLRFTNYQVLNNFEAVCRQVEEMLPLNKGEDDPPNPPCKGGRRSPQPPFTRGLNW